MWNAADIMTVKPGAKITRDEGKHRSFARFVILACAIILMAGLTPFTHAAAQNLPYHADPTARENIPDLAAITSIRFLTSPDFPPFNYRDEKGELVGFHIDLARALCTDLEAVCTMQAWPWDQAADALAENQGSALIGGLALNDETAQRFDFSSVYLALPARFVTKTAILTSFEPSTNDITITVRKGSAHAQFVERLLPRATLVEVETEIAALEAVQTGEADAYFGDAMRAAFWLNENTTCCDFAGEAYFRPDLFGQGFTIAVPAGHDILRVALNFGLIRLQRSGKLDELYLRWFPISFY